MNSLAEWLAMHKFDVALVSEILDVINSKQLAFYPNSFLDEYSQEKKSFNLDSQKDCFKKMIIPAFENAFGQNSLIGEKLLFIEFKTPQNEPNHIPYTEDRGLEKAPIIVMNWNGKFSDLICLAHETAHAIQHQFSEHIFTPPVAREVCAFLGELILINWSQKYNLTLFGELVGIWFNENNQYLAVDVNDLVNVLKRPDSQYQYRLNYPLARIAAVFLFDKLVSTKLLKLFSANKDMMTFLPFEELAAKAGDVDNHLMPFHSATTEHPIIAKYRELGAMVVLDIKHGGRVAMRSIENYHHKLRFHVDENTYRLVIGDSRKPIGYATWTKKNQNKIFIHHLIAPYGDHLFVHQQIAKYLGFEGQVTLMQIGDLREE